MEDPDSTVPAETDRLDFRAFLRTAPDFDLLDLRRSTVPARVVVLDPAVEFCDLAGTGEAP